LVNKKCYRVWKEKQSCVDDFVCNNKQKNIATTCQLQDNKDVVENCFVAYTKGHKCSLSSRKVLQFSNATNYWPNNIYGRNWNVH
jgi:hypothetical protein